MFTPPETLFTSLGGIEDSLSPNHRALLTMSSKLAFLGNYTLWGPAQDGFLYFVSCDATDATYGMDCITSYGYETGSSWYATCSELVNDIIPTVHESFMFAAKCVKAPYKTPLGPDVISIDLSRNGPRSNMFSLSLAVSDEDYIVPHAIFEEGVKSQNIA